MNWGESTLPHTSSETMVAAAAATKRRPSPGPRARWRPTQSVHEIAISRPIRTAVEMPAITAGPLPSSPWLPNELVDRHRDAGQRVQAEQVGRADRLQLQRAVQVVAGEVPGARGRHHHEGGEHRRHHGEARAEAGPGRAGARPVALPDDHHRDQREGDQLQQGGRGEQPPRELPALGGRGPEGPDHERRQRQVEARLHQVADQQGAHRHQHRRPPSGGARPCRSRGPARSRRGPWRTGTRASGSRRSPRRGRAGPRPARRGRPRGAGTRG